jgi:hypothetical protein
MQADCDVVLVAPAPLAVSAIVVAAAKARRYSLKMLPMNPYSDLSRLRAELDRAAVRLQARAAVA